MIGGNRTTILSKSNFWRNNPKTSGAFALLQGVAEDDKQK